MLRNKREVLSHVPMKKLKENLKYYDELIGKIEKSIKELKKEIKEELYERLVSKGKAKKLALVTVAHKLLRQAYGVLKSRRPFDENFCT
jgi:predicted nuclease of restriction endonuclease-like (RecB) superfamily